MTLNKLQITVLLFIFMCIGFGIGLGYYVWQSPKYTIFLETIQDSLGRKHVDTTYYLPHGSTPTDESEEDLSGTDW